MEELSFHQGFRAFCPHRDVSVDNVGKGGASFSYAVSTVKHTQCLKKAHLRLRCLGRRTKPFPLFLYSQIVGELERLTSSWPRCLHLHVRELRPGAGKSLSRVPLQFVGKGWTDPDPSLPMRRPQLSPLSLCEPRPAQPPRTTGGRAEGGGEAMNKEGGSEKLGQGPPQPAPSSTHRAPLGLRSTWRIWELPQVPAVP